MKEERSSSTVRKTLKDESITEYTQNIKLYIEQEKLRLIGQAVQQGINES